MSKPAVFLDRDGTIIQEAEYLADPAGVVLLPGAAEGIRLLRQEGFAAVVVSNQSGVARGYFDEATVRRVNARLEELLAAAGAGLDGVYYCPHYPQGSVAAYARACDCRKPAPGMLLAAARDLGLDLAKSWVVGDKASDIEFGAKQGLKTILVLTGYGAATRDQGFGNGPRPDFIAADLTEAGRHILGALGHE
ncbi:MAG: HAD family hydrolase [candidate division FCPU426 bacterium]